MKQYKWEKRDKKLFKRKYGMRTSGSSVKLLEKIKIDKANQLKLGE